MRYYKINTDGVISAGTINADGKGNITKKEYDNICSLLKSCPEGCVLIETDEGYEYQKPDQKKGKAYEDPSVVLENVFNTSAISTAEMERIQKFVKEAGIEPSKWKDEENDERR